MGARGYVFCDARKRFRAAFPPGLSIRFATIAFDEAVGGGTDGYNESRNLEGSVGGKGGSILRIFDCKYTLKVYRYWEYFSPGIVGQVC